MKCPTRRGGAAKTLDDAPFRGPQGDYAMAALPAETAISSSTNQFWRHGWPNRGRVQPGPFRYADSDVVDTNITAPGINGGAAFNPFNKRFISRWSSRDDIGYWQDGTSNQIMFGEKAISLNRLGTCGINNDREDCSFLTMPHEGDFNTTIIRSFGSAINHADPPNNRNFDIPLARPQSNTGGGQITAFGSWHPGVCNFAIGDGSIRAMSATTPTRILYLLSHVSDGTAVSLP